MKIEFDPSKDKSNVAKHGLSLSFGATIFDDPSHLVLPTVRAVDGETRLKIVGKVEGKFYTAVFVWRASAARFISVRRSNNGEERLYRSAS